MIDVDQFTIRAFGKLASRRWFSRGRLGPSGQQAAQPGKDRLLKLIQLSILKRATIRNGVPRSLLSNIREWGN